MKNKCGGTKINRFHTKRGRTKNITSDYMPYRAFCKTSDLTPKTR